MRGRPCPKVDLKSGTTTRGEQSATIDSMTPHASLSADSLDSGLFSVAASLSPSLIRNLTL